MQGGDCSGEIKSYTNISQTAQYRGWMWEFKNVDNSKKICYCGWLQLNTTAKYQDNLDDFIWVKQKSAEKWIQLKDSFFIYFGSCFGLHNLTKE